jgi:hypothetical protein
MGGKKQAMMCKLQYVQAFLMVIANVILIGDRLLQGLKLIMESYSENICDDDQCIRSGV